MLRTHMSPHAAFKQDKMQMGSDTKPGIAKCAELCDSLMGCQAFSISLGGDYSGMCIGYSGQTEGGNAYGCNVETGKDDEALFLRLAGKVTEPACAPDGRARPTQPNAYTRTHMHTHIHAHAHART
jgi:hypothetical protein